ncbi:MAG: VCBS repeat-containing protein, partial [Cellvibrionales bacterium]|nr:VCBS repeat-containing protein [Cellvibrionales bacterium]
MSFSALSSADNIVTMPSPFAPIISDMSLLESRHDPKCYATASRLEDFIFGTPLDDSARFSKIEWQKKLIKSIWLEATLASEKRQEQTIAKETIFPLFARSLNAKKQPDGAWYFQLPNRQTITIDADTQRQYSSIAYSHRALLAVQQDNLFDDKLLLPLSDDALKTFRLFIDLTTLAALKIADDHARLTDKHQIDSQLFASAWKSIQQHKTNQRTNAIKQPLSAEKIQQHFALTQQLISQKITAYAQYNHIAHPVFMRNLQVYFAKVPWPKDPAAGQKIKQDFHTIMLGLAEDIYAGAEKVAQKRQRQIIRIQDVQDFIQFTIPHKVNAYEDVTFFPNQSPSHQTTIESYDMDAFRDSGMHWRYLGWALESKNFKATLPLDPFSAELFVENLSQLGVLIFRLAGQAAKQEQAPTLNHKHLAKSITLLQTRINNQQQLKKETITPPTLASTVNPNANNTSDIFKEVSQSLGVKTSHYTADWLSRLIRSYRVKEGNIGKLTIPPAFGGSGIAAEDLNNDGFQDLLILSGRGNRLFLNNEGQGFTDITASAGIQPIRPDNTFPEPRQPLIVDFDNDGLSDILITYVHDPHRLYKNLGNGQFKEVTKQANLGGANYAGGPATAFDFNQDGLLDIYIAYFGDYIQGVSPTLARENLNGLPNKLFINKGNFTFEDITDKAGGAHTGWGQALTHTDLDGDGWQDLIVGNDFGLNVYYKNINGKKLKNITHQLGTQKPSFTMGIGLADLNDDEIPDIYISNIVTMNKDEKYVLPNENTPQKFDPNK